ncbi:hypothetical protein BJL95_11675 [Methylomonas sp. LWB]|nr:hypothetical protein BJL95_11675 [Methylomonas sp. LWB]
MLSIDSPLPLALRPNQNSIILDGLLGDSAAGASAGCDVRVLKRLLDVELMNVRLAAADI